MGRQLCLAFVARELDERLGFGELVEQHLTDSRVKYAIRIPANENLLRDVEELLKRPVGDPRNRPLVERQEALCIVSGLGRHGER